SVVHLERAAGSLPEPVGDGVPVHRLPGERLEHEYVERAVDEIGSGFHRRLSRVRDDGDRRHHTRSTEQVGGEKLARDGLACKKPGFAYADEPAITRSAWRTRTPAPRRRASRRRSPASVRAPV